MELNFKISLEYYQVSLIAQLVKNLAAMLLLLRRFSRVRLCATPWTAAHQASPSMGLSRQEHWSGLPFPSPWLQCRRPQFGSLVRKTRWRREKLPTPVFYPAEFHRLYSPWGPKSQTQLSDFHLFSFRVLSSVPT